MNINPASSETLHQSSREQKQPDPDDDGRDGSCDALTGRGEAFDGDVMSFSFFLFVPLSVEAVFP